MSPPTDRMPREKPAIDTGTIIEKIMRVFSYFLWIISYTGWLVNVFSLLS